MTRINCVPVTELSGPHLVAEYRELPRIFTAVCKLLAKGGSQRHDRHAPYVLGKGHMKFFYTRLSYLNTRHADLVEEMLARGYNPNMRGSLWAAYADRIPMSTGYWNHWWPNNADMAVNRARIAQRNAEGPRSKMVKP